ncbi:hypothetical protein [Flavobacterium silvaticum]|uniref:Uncharacterized protein n=1 Tax=Flavobacterium silvaticum TaxID=1852020 RepID=A0A972FJW7_9FLAO|nr:hypothetical protein [Flavobacterium silvaticum]NMH27123.1 hypothetical protein [Flavobacterium silvaticum]
MGFFGFLKSIFGSGTPDKESVDRGLDAVEEASNVVLPSTELLPEQSEPKPSDEDRNL